MPDYLPKIEVMTENRMRKFLTVTGVSSLLSVLPLASMADEGMGGFAGGSYLYGKLDNLEVGDTAVSLGDLDNFDDNRSSWKAFVGAWVTPWLGLEAQYIELGEYEDLGVSVDPSAYTGAALFGLPFSEAGKVYAKVGQMWWEADIDGPLGFSDERDGSTLFYGVGVALKLLPNLNVRAEYERAELDDDDVDADVDFASIGAEFIF